MDNPSGPDQISGAGRARRLRSVFAASLGFALGLLTFLGGVTLDTVFRRYGITGWPALLDDLLVAVICGLVVFFYERSRQKRLRQQLAVNRLVNHHVRNALQVICYARFAGNHDEEAKRIQESVSRIEWTLREVLERWTA